MPWVLNRRRCMMKIGGSKDALLGIGVMLIVSGSIPAVSFYTDPDSLGANVFCILLALAMALPASYILLKLGVTYYTLDEEGITEHCFSKTRTFLWSECRFIKRTQVEASRGYVEVIICSKIGLPAGMSDRKSYNYKWPNKETMRISNCTDEIYREFLTWCGGERDIRE